MSDNGGNGSEKLIKAKDDFFFQTEPFKGDDNRKNRIKLSQVEQLLINTVRDIKNDVQTLKNHDKNCNIHPELKPRQDHIVGIIKNASDDGISVEKGLNEIAKNEQFIKTLRTAVNQGGTSFITKAINAIIWFVLLLIGLGLIEFLKGKGVI